MKTMQWRVGVTAATYSYVGESSLGTSGFMRSPDPFVELAIPKGTTNILQQITTGKKLEGFIEVTDWNAVQELLYNTDVDNATGGNQYAVIPAGNTRTPIDYFALVGTLIQIVNATDARTTPTVSYVFTNAVIRDVPYLLEQPNDPVRITFYADSVTPTVA
jgi:hypothetical protein